MSESYRIRRKVKAARERGRRMANRRWQLDRERRDKESLLFAESYPNKTHNKERPQMKILVTRQELLAALLFASTDESRFVLNSVLIEVAPRRKPTIITTDGRRLSVIQSQAEQEQEFTVKFQLLLRSDFVKPICALSKAIGQKLFPWIALEVEDGSKEVSVELFGAKCFLTAKENAIVDGEFPNWRGCVPDKNAIRTQVNDLGVNAEFLADFAKAAKLFEVSPVVQINLIDKDSAIEVKLTNVSHFYGLVMPCKADERVDYQPEFLNLVKDLPQQIAEEKNDEATVTISSPGSGIAPVTMTAKKFSQVAKDMAKKTK